MNKNTNCSINNVYRLEDKVPVTKAILFGLRHILTMFISNLVPTTIIVGVTQPALSRAQTVILLQNTMFVVGIVTMVQLYPIWRIGSELPIVVGVSFTFVTVLNTTATNYGYPAVVGAVLIGDTFEGAPGPLVKHWYRIITPTVATFVVTTIGFSSFTVGTRSFGGGRANDFGPAQNLALGTVALLAYLSWSIFAERYLEQLSVLADLIVGYAVTIFLERADLSLIMPGGIISFPHLLPFMPEFHTGVIISACIIFLVSTAGTIGDTLALVSGSLNREIAGKGISGSLIYNGCASTLSTVFGCPPVASFSQNVGLVATVEVVNRFIIMTGAACVVLAGPLPPVGNLSASLPQIVLGGYTIAMFGTTLASGVQIIAECGLSQRNIIIVSLSLAVGIGFATASGTGIWNTSPELIQSIFSANVVAVVFVISVLLSLILPGDVGIEALEG